MDSTVDHLAIAKLYIDEAFKLLERGDPFDAAEKVWAAVKHATTALTMSVLGGSVPPKGISWRSFVKEAFMKVGLNEEEVSKWALYFIDVRKGLHGDCFYGLTYEEEEHKPIIERAKEYIDLIDNIFKET